MYFIAVTLDVSKLSGWLSAVATCRVERRAYDAERGVGREAGGRGPAAQRASGMHGERTRMKAWGLGHTRSAPQTCSSCP